MLAAAGWAENYARQADTGIPLRFLFLGGLAVVLAILISAFLLSLLWRRISN
jgi:hypothetical protein